MLNMSAGWSCDDCTFENHADLPACEMCNGARPRWFASSNGSGDGKRSAATTPPFGQGARGDSKGSLAASLLQDRSPLFAHRQYHHQTLARGDCVHQCSAIATLNTRVLSHVFEFVDKYVVFTRAVCKSWLEAAKHLGRRVLVREPWLQHTLVVDQQWEGVVASNIGHQLFDAMPMPLCTNAQVRCVKQLCVVVDRTVVCACMQVTELDVRHAPHFVQSPTLWPRLRTRFTNVTRFKWHDDRAVLFPDTLSNDLPLAVEQILARVDGAFCKLTGLELMLHGDHLHDQQVFRSSRIRVFPHLTSLKTNVKMAHWNDGWSRTLTELDMTCVSSSTDLSAPSLPIQLATFVKLQSLTVRFDAPLVTVHANWWRDLLGIPNLTCVDIHECAGRQGPNFNLVAALVSLALSNKRGLTKIHLNGGQPLLVDDTCIEFRMYAFPGIGTVVQDCPVQLMPGTKVDRAMIAAVRKCRPQWRNLFSGC